MSTRPHVVEEPVVETARKHRAHKEAVKAGPGVGRIVFLALLSAAILAGGWKGYKIISFYAHHEETEDAQIDGHINPVLPRVAGYVTQVGVHENEQVKAGRLLVQLDDRDLRARLEVARAAVVNAQAKVKSARANVLATLPVRERTALDRRRYEDLVKTGEVSTQQNDAARSAAEAAQAQYDAALAQVAVAEAEVTQKQADLKYAQLQLQYTSLEAPSEGVVSRKSVEVGQYVQVGQQLMTLVQDPDVWVVANFKETQLRRMHPGQKVTFEVDAYPGREFRGHVESLAAATGARFSLLPPDNATGNFTKVVQRVPVKILIDDAADPAHPLRIGMSVNAVVNLD